MDIFITIVFSITGLVAAYFAWAAHHDLTSGGHTSAGPALFLIGGGAVGILITSLIILGSVWL